mmetsp:Transcript_9094/g.31651  ORF Transcript_9094/g.31651 Transcript_9094/m.31651 type:complete len:264 (-) Transcript_9094:699-1490(-)
MSASVLPGRSGSGTAFAASMAAPSRFGVARAMKPRSAPFTPSSTFRYATACARSCASCSSANSVLPMSASSSASHEQSITVLRGRHPAPCSAPSAAATSSSTAVPLLGSVAPPTHASRWLPTITTRSGSTAPSKRATTLRISPTVLFIRTSMATRAGPGPMAYGAPATPPDQDATSSAGRSPAPPMRRRTTAASDADTGTHGISGRPTRGSLSGSLSASPPGSAAHPGVSGSPSFLYIDPRCTPSMGRNLLAGYGAVALSGGP